MSKTIITESLALCVIVCYWIVVSYVRVIMKCNRDMTTKKTIDDRFYSKVSKNGPDDCWFWRGALSSGYGVFHINGHQEGAHRVSWMLCNGPIPKGMWVLHHCDVRDCVNPKHLYVGTVKDNVADAMVRGRWNPHLCGRPGESHHRAKLTETQVRKILTDSRPHYVIAIDYAVSRQLIQKIKAGKNWKHIRTL